MSTHIWLRAESKPREQRRVLTPDDARKLVDAGFSLTIESSTQAAFSDDVWRAQGLTLVPEHSWITDAPQDAIILGLKELASTPESLPHRHIHFAHVYKNQAGWKNTLRRFIDGCGVLYDLEYLVDERGQRVAAFGYWAGYAGAALSLLGWAGQCRNDTPILKPVVSCSDQQGLLADVQMALKSIGKKPRVLVIGALGRSGQGAVDLCHAAGAEVVEWDLPETRAGGPFAEILEFDILLNCVFVRESIPPFVTRSMLNSADRRLGLICDVSCDPYGTYNPLPVYQQCTTFERPVLRLLDDGRPLDLIAIDHLPSLLPVESSSDFCAQLLPHLLQLDDPGQGVWLRAEQVFRQKIAEMEQTV